MSQVTLYLLCSKDGKLFWKAHNLCLVSQHIALLLGMPFVFGLGGNPMSNERGFSFSWISLSFALPSKSEDTANSPNLLQAGSKRFKQITGCLYLPVTHADESQLYGFETQLSSHCLLCLLHSTASFKWSKIVFELYNLLLVISHTFFICLLAWI